MKIFVELKDHEEKLHQEFEWIVTDQGEISQLRDQIKLVFSIDHVFQQLWYNGAIIRSDTVNEAGMKDKETCIVKHSGLQGWEAALTSADSVERKKPDHLKCKFAREGSKLLNSLENSNFFTTYSTFFPKFIELSCLFDRYIIGIENNIKLAVESYFRKFYANEGLNISYSPKPDTGAQGGFVAHIGDIDFFVKNHCFMSRGSNHSRVDKREMFSYRMLQYIGVGAEVHFMKSAYSKCYTSRLALHIATRRVDGFQKRANRSDSSFTVEHQILLNFIRDVLFLGDLNSGNFGLDDKNQLVIVDFIVIPQRSCHHNTLLCGPILDHPSSIKTIQKWNLSENFTKTTESIEKECNQLKNILWRDGYEEYLEVVRQNIQLVKSILQ